LDIFRELVARGVYFTIGIEVLYSKHIQNIAAEIPFGQFLTETDNPGGPEEFIGKAGTPVLVKEVVRGIAEARKTTSEVIVQSVQANFVNLIRDDPWLANKYSKVLKNQTNSG
jgi:TatD DNase family protein